eukprot:763992-Hanusia_phi.AAC.2
MASSSSTRGTTWCCPCCKGTRSILTVLLHQVRYLDIDSCNLHTVRGNGQALEGRTWKFLSEDLRDCAGSNMLVKEEDSGNWSSAFSPVLPGERNSPHSGFFARMIKTSRSGIRLGFAFLHVELDVKPLCPCRPDLLLLPASPFPSSSSSFTSSQPLPSSNLSFSSLITCSSGVSGQAWHELRLVEFRWRPE